MLGHRLFRISAVAGTDSGEGDDVPDLRESERQRGEEGWGWGGGVRERERMTHPPTEQHTHTCPIASAEADETKPRTNKTAHSLTLVAMRHLSHSVSRRVKLRA
jgi:hypothetical protein